MSVTKQTRIIFPADLNNHGTLFGGKALQWMDEVAYISVLRAMRMNAVTISVDKLRYVHPVFAGDIIEIQGQVTETGRVKIKVQVRIIREEMTSGETQTAIEAEFVFALITKDHKVRGIREKPDKKSTFLADNL